MTPKITAQGKEISITFGDKNDYISLTDIAKYKNQESPADIIKNWMRNRNTLEFLGTWEKLNNPDFKLVEFDQFRNEAGLNAFVMSPKKWIKTTKATGITSKSGRYGRTYAHSDIAFEFASWISPEFKLYIIQDYQRLKQEKSYKNQIEWEVNRYISKLNYAIHTDAIKENLLTPKLTTNQIKYTYASDADLLNMALYGMTAKEWKEKFPEKGNLRDNSSIEQLIIMNNIQTINAEMINNNLPSHERLESLNKIALNQMKLFKKNNPKALEDIKKLQGH